MCLSGNGCFFSVYSLDQQRQSKINPTVCIRIPFVIGVNLIPSFKSCKTKKMAKLSRSALQVFYNTVHRKFQYLALSLFKVSLFSSFSRMRFLRRSCDLRNLSLASSSLAAQSSLSLRRFSSSAALSASSLSLLAASRLSCSLRQSSWRSADRSSSSALLLCFWAKASRWRRSRGGMLGGKV